MKNLKNKLNKKGGYTLVEMLIVVAIIAILIAVSIPLIGTALERARDATDDANFRSAAALGHIEYLTEGDAAEGTYYYVIGADGKVTGALEKVGAGVTTVPAGAYTSRCTETAGTHTETGTKKDSHIKITIDPDATDEEDIVKVEWAA